MRWFTDICVRYVERLMPDPYLFAVILTLLVVGLIFLLVPGANAGGIVDSWYQGVWGTDNIFTFAMQMVLILVSGYTLAEAPVVKRGLGWLASKPRNQVQGRLALLRSCGDRIGRQLGPGSGRWSPPGTPGGSPAEAGELRLHGRGWLHGVHGVDKRAVKLYRTGQHRPEEQAQRYLHPDPPCLSRALPTSSAAALP